MLKLIILKIKNIIINKKDDIIYDCIKTMSLCNNVTPILDKKGNVNSYQASSPDEISLVEFAVFKHLNIISFFVKVPVLSLNK